MFFLFSVYKQLKKMLKSFFSLWKIFFWFIVARSVSQRLNLIMNPPFHSCKKGKLTWFYFLPLLSVKSLTKNNCSVKIGQFPNESNPQGSIVHFGQFRTNWSWDGLHVLNVLLGNWLSPSVCLCKKREIDVISTTFHVHPLLSVQKLKNLLKSFSLCEKNWFLASRSVSQRQYWW